MRAHARACRERKPLDGTTAAGARTRARTRARGPARGRARARVNIVYVQKYPKLPECDIKVLIFGARFIIQSTNF